jgi:hypothetical protein
MIAEIIDDTLSPLKVPPMVTLIPKYPIYRNKRRSLDPFFRFNNRGQSEAKRTFKRKP